MQRLLKGLFVLFVAVTLISCGKDSGKDSNYMNYLYYGAEAENNNIPSSSIIDEPEIGIVDISFSISLSDIILPEIDMEPSLFEITGIGPGEATFSISTDKLEVDDIELVAGEWTITVTAFNSDSIIIYEGIGTVTVYDGQTIELTIEITPIEGYGTLDLTGIWEISVAADPSIESYLIPFQGAPNNLVFQITGGTTATYTNINIPTGYYTLIVKLSDGGVPVSSYVEVLRIINNETTSKAFEFLKDGATVEIEIIPENNDPIEVTMSGKLNKMTVFEVMTLNASAPLDVGEVTYQWYLDGETIETGSECALSGLSEGIHTIVVTAFSIDGKRAGSAAHAFIVFQIGQLNSASIAWNGDLEQVEFTWTTENLNADFEYWIYPYMSFTCCDEPFGSAPEFEKNILADMYSDAIKNYRPASGGTGAWNWNETIPTNPSGQLVLLAYDSTEGEAFVADVEDINVSGWISGVPGGEIANVEIDWRPDLWSVVFTWTASNLEVDYDYWIYPYVSFSGIDTPFGDTPDYEAFLLSDMYEIAIENYRPAVDDTGVWEWNGERPADPTGQLALLAYNPVTSESFVVDLVDINTGIWNNLKDIYQFQTS